MASEKMASRKAKFPLDTNSLYEAAVKALARRARSSAEIRLVLARKKADPKQIEKVLRRLKENGYLDDTRFARGFASARLENQLHGKVRVRLDLRRRGVTEHLSQQATAQAYQDVDEAQLLRRYIKRKVNISEAFSRPSKVAGLFRRLLRAGFASDTIVQELKRIRESPLVKGRADLPSGSEPVAWDELLDSLSETTEAEAEFDQ